MIWIILNFTHNGWKASGSIVKQTEATNTKNDLHQKNAVLDDIKPDD